jgi:hypothetical protein
MKYLDTYKTLQEKTDKYNETNDCAVKAVALAANVSYEVAHNALTKAGRKPRKGTATMLIENALRSLGYKSGMGFSSNLFPYKYKVSYDYSSRRWTKKASYGTAKNNNIPSTGTYMALTRSHVFVVRDGVTECYVDGRKHRIIGIYEVKRSKSSNITKFPETITTPITAPTTSARRSSKYEWVIDYGSGKNRYKRMTKAIKYMLLASGVTTPEVNTKYKAKGLVAGVPTDLIIYKRQITA